VLLTRMDISDVRNFQTGACVLADDTADLADTIPECAEYLLGATADGGGAHRKRE